MSGVLLRRSVHSNYKLVLIFMGVLTLYGGMIVSMFDPELGDSLTLMAKSMPEVFAMFNMTDVGTTLLDFVSNYLYGFLLLAFPLVCIVLMTSRLVSQYVDRGSMAYLLATPVSRARIIFTQALVQWLGAACLVAYVTAMIGGISTAMFPDALEWKPFLLLNVGLLGLLTLFAGVCFFFACIFNDAKYATGLGAGTCIAFVLVNMLSNVGDKFDWLVYCTPITLYDRAGIVAGDADAVWKIVILYTAGFALTAIGGAAFCKRDIPV